jgi:hypothetical protein
MITLFDKFKKKEKNTSKSEKISHHDLVMQTQYNRVGVVDYINRKNLDNIKYYVNFNDYASGWFESKYVRKLTTEEKKLYLDSINYNL